MWPTMERNCGSQFWFAAAVVMRLATNELPSNEPATTRQTRIAAIMPKEGPRRRVIAVCLTC